ncbi:MAG: hypothetical protein QHJ73_09175, partial [Armatimonadota bacterium]|nr:hypothetical protein [Armatimonadota bacterium]
MKREYYLDLARSGLRMPIGADLVLHERRDPEAVLEDGARLGAVVAETAERYHTPLAVPRMDLELEKTALLRAIGVPAAEIPKYHFEKRPPEGAAAAVAAFLTAKGDSRFRAHVESITWVAANTRLLPVGMSIGPFSLLTKLLSDPITPIFLAGSGLSATDDPEVGLLEEVLALAEATVMASLRVQVSAGAKAVFIAEPAANQVYFSPKQIAAGSNIFDRYVMGPNHRLANFLAAE